MCAICLLFSEPTIHLEFGFDRERTCFTYECTNDYCPLTPEGWSVVDYLDYAQAESGLDLLHFTTRIPTSNVQFKPRLGSNQRTWTSSRPVTIPSGVKGVIWVHRVHNKWEESKESSEFIECTISGRSWGYRAITGWHWLALSRATPPPEPLMCGSGGGVDLLRANQCAPRSGPILSYVR